MADFPSIATAQVGTTEAVYLPQVRTEFEGGYVQSRKSTTRARKRWNLYWNALSEADYQTLEAFFIANQGGSFNWTHPITSTVHVCRFSGDTLPGDPIIPGYRRVELPIEEV
jgi:hypothetical protein